MANVLTSAYSVLPYCMLLTTIFCHFGLDLNSESDIWVSKPSDAIDNGSISQLGYELHGHQWVKKTTCSPAVEINSDEEVAMDIPPSSPRPLTTGAGSSSALPDWCQNLSQHLDTISLHIQWLRQDHQDDIHTLSKEQDWQLRTLSEQDWRFWDLFFQKS